MGTFARDDTGKTPIWRNPDEIVYRVSDAAKQQIPANEEYKFIKAEAPVWVIPQQELRGAVWLGWNTQSPEVVNQVNGGVDLIFEGHQGPGDFHVFIQAGNFAGPQQLWNSTQKKPSQYMWN
ncbi:choice-of-anchor M domain-containing protein [Arcanobacterium hippocoleae]